MKAKPPRHEPSRHHDEAIAHRRLADAVNVLTGCRLAGAVDRSGRRLIDVHGVAEMYGGISWRTVLRWADRGLIPKGYKLSGRRLWSLAELEKHLEGGCRPVRKGVKP
jgi:hypothetical protein